MRIAEKISRVDVLKVDVEGAELKVLQGLSAADWRKVQQVVLEVENFATKDAICALLEGKGFGTSWVPSERERSPGVQSEVCMVYASRARAGAASGASAAAAAPAAAAAAAVEPEADAVPAPDSARGPKRRTKREQA